MLSWKTKRRILLGISGGIAAYKTPEIVRVLRRFESEVDVVLTEAAESFVSPMVLATLAGRRVWRQRDYLSVEDGWKIPHISLSETAEACVVAPATANVLRRASFGEAETLLGSALLATCAPVVLFPAMNVHMWEHAATRSHVAKCRELGYRVVEPEEGALACGYEGKGRLPSVDVIVEEIFRVLCPKKDLAGKRILITAGPTREFLDPVRFLSNPSSGKMGYALARVAWYRGADVTLVSGPVSIEPPHGVRLVRVESALDMRDAVMSNLAEADIIIKAAAVGDYRAESISASKIKREAQSTLPMALVQNPDIAAEVGRLRRSEQYLVGFAAESDDLERYAREKLIGKGLDMIVANRITGEKGAFGSDSNEVSIFLREGRLRDLAGSKEVVADGVLDAVEVQVRLR